MQLLQEPFVIPAIGIEIRLGAGFQKMHVLIRSTGGSGHS